MSQGDCETYAIKEFAREFHLHATAITNAILSLTEVVRQSAQGNGNGPAATKADLLETEQRLGQILNKIMGAEQDLATALGKIDTATTAIAAAVQANSDTTQVISDELDALILKVNQGGIDPTAFAAQAQALADRLQAASDGSEKLVPVLKAIATKGAANPVPVPVPTPTP